MPVCPVSQDTNLFVPSVFWLSTAENIDSAVPFPIILEGASPPTKIHCMVICLCRHASLGPNRCRLHVHLTVTACKTEWAFGVPFEGTIYSKAVLEEYFAYNA